MGIVYIRHRETNRERRLVKLKNYIESKRKEKIISSQPSYLRSVLGEGSRA